MDGIRNHGWGEAKEGAAASTRSNTTPAYGQYQQIRSKRSIHCYVLGISRLYFLGPYGMVCSYAQQIK